MLRPSIKNKFLSPETITFLGTWLLLMTAGRDKFFRDPGTFSHLAWGDHLLSGKGLIHSDIYSFTFHGQPWIFQQWLADCLISVIHRFSGFEGLLLVAATSFSLLNAWLLNRLLKAGIHFSAALLIVSLFTLAGAHHYHVRPHVASILFLAFIFSRFCDFEAGRLKFGPTSMEGFWEDWVR